MKKRLLIIVSTFIVALSFSQLKSQPVFVADSKMPALQLLNSNNSITTAKPLDQLTFTGVAGKSFQVLDANGKMYASASLKPLNTFTVAGALGRHSIIITDIKGKQSVIKTFTVNAVTTIDDGGYYKQMFDMYYNGMNKDGEGDGAFSIKWNGNQYHVFVPWVLDNYHTMKGMQYFSPAGKDLADIMRQAQREDGMIYSFIQYQRNADYFLTRDKKYGYSKIIGDKIFVRQPTENHPEYLFVNTIYDCWKAAAKDEWMKQHLTAASKALNYTINDPARWSNRFQLLKRVYTIDSWDFGVEDEYTPDIGMSSGMIIDKDKSKFGVFFGDNTGYITACYQLAEMLDYSGDTMAATIYRKRGDQIKERLNKLAWNGHFFAHFIDEDSTVIRKLGVDEKSQIAQSNAYSLNRNISTTQSKAIIETYLNLKNNLPVGSPGEWYAIYPPFQKGFGSHQDIWQYMNGGVGGHVPGELARGAFENGYEKYGVDILNRLFELGKKYDNKVYFAYTGSLLPPPPKPTYKPLNLVPLANMDFWDKGSSESKPWMFTNRSGDDLRNLPTGSQLFADIRFNVIDPEKNNRKAVLAVANREGLPAAIEIPVNETAACIYLLHTASKPASEGVVGVLFFEFEDGSKQPQYIISDKHLTYWWFSELKNEYAGIAWYGKSPVSEGVGLSWCAINNPFPEKKIKNIKLQSPEGKGIYTVFAVTLSSQKHHVPVKMPSYGGPDRWAAATAMAAMVEGLAGVRNASESRGFQMPVIAPRWIHTKSDTVNASICFNGYNGYVAYQYFHDAKRKKIELNCTGSGSEMQYHILLPEGSSKATEVTINNKPVAFVINKNEQSYYVDFKALNIGVQKILVHYN